MTIKTNIPSGREYAAHGTQAGPEATLRAARAAGRGRKIFELEHGRAVSRSSPASTAAVDAKARMKARLAPAEAKLRATGYLPRPPH
jgi:hypothetical protein